MFFRAAGFDVDDDNDPAPENIPGVEGETVPDAQTWGWKSTGLNEHPAKMNGCNDVDFHDHPQHVFLLLSILIPS
jgi:hypothetical protein